MIKISKICLQQNLIVIKGEGIFDQFKYILDSCLLFWRNLNESGKKIFFPHFSMFFKAFSPKSLSQIPARCKHLLVIVKNLITNIRTKFKVFQIPFPPILSYFPTLLIFSDFLDSWIHFSKNLNEILHMGCGRSGLPKLGLLLQIQSSYNPLMGIICVYFKKKLEYRYEKG